MKDGQLLEVLKSVYGLPDATRAWWEEGTSFLRECGYQHSRLDAAFLIWYHPDGSVGLITVLHVDDIMIASDGSNETERTVIRIHNKYPFGEWNVVEDIESITYTGRTIKV